MHLSHLKDDFVLTIGSFDGIHLGHRKVIQAMQELAAGTAQKLVVLTFDPCPKILLGRKSNVIYDLETNKMLLRSLGVAHVEVINTTSEFLNRSPEDFFDYIRCHNLKAIVVGENFRFGHRASGDVELLRKLCGNEITLKLLPIDELAISSSKIRSCINLAKIQEAKRMLGGELTFSLKNSKGLGLLHELYVHEGVCSSLLIPGMYYLKVTDQRSVLVIEVDNSYRIYSSGPLTAAFGEIHELITLTPSHGINHIKNCLGKPG